MTAVPALGSPSAQAKPALTFSQVKAEVAANTPAAVVSLPLTAWAADWRDRPGGDTEVGIRLVSEADILSARAEADKRALEYYPDGGPGAVETYNSLLMAAVVSGALCQPFDASIRWWDEGDGPITQALTSQGIEGLFWHVNRVMTAESVLMPEASLEDMAALAELIRSPEAWRRIDGAAARRVRRMLRACLDEMAGGEADV